MWRFFYKGVNWTSHPVPSLVFSDKLPGYGPSGYSVEKNQKRIATFVTVSQLSKTELPVSLNKPLDTTSNISSEPGRTSFYCNQGYTSFRKPSEAIREERKIKNEGPSWFCALYTQETSKGYGECLFKSSTSLEFVYAKIWVQLFFNIRPSKESSQPSLRALTS